MEASGLSSFSRYRRLGGFFEAGFQPSGQPEPRPEVGEEDEVAARCQRVAAEGSAFEDDDRWVTVLVSVVRIVVCFVTMMATTFVWALIMLVLLPWPYARVRQGNLYGHLTGWLMVGINVVAMCYLGTLVPSSPQFSGKRLLRVAIIMTIIKLPLLSSLQLFGNVLLMRILGNPIKIDGSEFSNTKAIYICNHASPLDIFLVMWLTPTGTVGVAKKEIIWYPLFGQLYVLANHLRIDRSNPTAAIESIKEAARAIIKNNLSLIIFPEGTRSKTGRLLPFKKGFVHIAMQSRLPIVPIVVTGTHLAWRKNSLRVRPAPLTVKFLPPIKTNEWESRKVSEYVEMVHTLYVNHLPKSQQPASSSSSSSSSGDGKNS